MNHDDDQRAQNCSDRVPSLLAIFDAIDKRQAIRVVEYQLGGFKRNSMFAAINLVFVPVPFESVLEAAHNLSVRQIWAGYSIAGIPFVYQ